MPRKMQVEIVAKTTKNNTYSVLDGVGSSFMQWLKQNSIQHGEITVAVSVRQGGLFYIYDFDVETEEDALLILLTF